MNNKNLLYLNLALDDEDVSLGFANTWVKQFSNKFENIDIITLNKSNANIASNNKVNIYGLLKDDNTSKISKFLLIRKTIKELTSTSSYDLCFSHMSPLLLLMTKFYSLKKFPTILWYTHPKPKEFSKKIILILSLFFCDKVVTASNSSFPYKSNKLNVVGHAIDYEQFLNKRRGLLNKEFLILSRISKSKNLEVAIDGFLKSKFSKHNISIIGDAVTKEDSEYKNKLSKKYEGNKNVIFLGKIPHRDLPSLMNKYTYHINATPEGFYDKSVLEAISNGLFSLYANKDYDKHFKKDMQFLTKFELNQRSLADVLNSVYEQEDKNILKIIEYSQLSVSNESIQTIFERIVATVES
jgi:glycosyltransferase involved in cell wall biosynthesis